MNKRLLTLTICAALGFTAGLVRGQSSGSADRFDHKVRELLFAGFGGNAEALEKGMKACEEALAENPKHGEAMVWHGAAVFYQSGQAFRKGDQARGMDLYVKGTGEMDKAVELEPENPGVRIPRAAVLMSAAASMQGPQAKAFAQKALTDYEWTLNWHGATSQLDTHPRGELLQGLANGYRIVGDLEKAKAFYARIEKEMPETAYAKRAAKFRETGSLEARETTCIGCHVKK